MEFDLLRTRYRSLVKVDRRKLNTNAITCPCPGLREVARKTDTFASVTGMEVKHRKCAIEHGQRTGNNWKKDAKTGDVKVMIQGAQLPVYDREDNYPYLDSGI